VLSSDRPGEGTPWEQGLTLIELALVLVVIALLAGAIMKGQQMIASSRVRTIASTATGVQSAYFAFLDRFARVPGDWDATHASAAIGVPVNGGGNSNGRLDTPPDDPWTESNALWEQLAKGGFINGTYTGDPVEPTTGNGLTPLNAYSRPILVGITPDYVGVSPSRRHVVVGRGMPVEVARELDVKLDEGDPGLGSVRATLDDAGITVFTGVHVWGGSQAECVDATPLWNVDSGADDCNAIMLF